LTLPAPAAEAYAVKYGLGRCIGYSVLSFGAWSFYWFYVNRRLVDGELAQGRDDALLHMFGLLVPVLNVFVTYWLWRDYNRLRVVHGLREFPAVEYSIGAIFLAPVFWCLALGPINEYWDVRLRGWAREVTRATTAERILIGTGIALWALWVLSIVLLIVLLALSS
jgi:hypothetical protein